MIKVALEWLGFSQPAHHRGHHGHEGHHGHHEAHGDEGHGHTHGVVDPTIVTTERGIWAIKWSFVILASTAAMQIVVVFISGSVALLADTIHNIGDAATAIPLWIAFAMARRKPSARFTYGYGRVEDIAGVIIVGLILFSALVAGWQAIDRLINPQEIGFLAAVIGAGIVGFIGNEVVAVFRIRVGREIDSAALIADGYHARVDGLTSLAVVFGAIGVWLGFPLADPIVGIVITIMIFGIVWQSAVAVFTRMLDGVEPELLDEIRHAAGHVPEVTAIERLRGRWIGHRLHVDADVCVDASLPVAAAVRLAEKLQEVAKSHIAPLDTLRVSFVATAAAVAGVAGAESHDHGDGHFHSHEWL